MTNRYWVLAVLMLMYFVNYVDRTLLYLLQESIKSEFRLSDWQMGLLGGTAFGIFYAACGLPIARLAERRNRVWLISASIVVWSLFTAACGLAANFVHLILARAGVGVGESGASPASHSILADCFPPHQRSTALSIFVLATPLGAAFAAIAGAAIADALGWRMTFIVVGLSGLLAALLLFFTVKEPTRGHSDPEQAKADLNTPFPTLLDVLRAARKKRAFLHVLVGSVLASLGYFAIHSFTVPHLLRKFDISLTTAGTIYAVIFGLGTALGMLLGGVAVDRFAKHDARLYGWMPAAYLIVACPMFIIGYWQTSLFATVAWLAVPGLLASAHVGATYSIMHNSFESRMRATVTAFLILSHHLVGLGLGPLIVGFLSDTFAASAFAGGDYAAQCKGGAAAAAGPLKEVCRSASSIGLQHGLMLIALLYGWASFHYVRAARYTRQDTLLGLGH